MRTVTVGALAFVLAVALVFASSVSLDGRDAPLVSTLGGPTPVEAATVAHPIRATVGFETGIVNLASIDGRLAVFGEGVTVSWGDGSSTPGLFGNCGGVFRTVDCDIFGTHRYTAAGSYTVTISYSLAGVFGPRAESVSTTATVVPAGEFVILSIGDSVASGEGDPVRPVTLDESAMWDDPDSNPDYPDTELVACHRSRLAGPALAAARVQATNVATFVHIACSGAEIEGGGLSLISQLQQARALLPRIDVLLISGGANDVGGGFGNVVRKCLRLGEGNQGRCDQDPEFEQKLADSIAELPAKYRQLALAIDCLRFEQGSGIVPDEACDGKAHPVPSLVVIADYFDPTRDRNGEFPSVLTSIACVGFTIAPAEWEFLYNHMVVPLNNAVAAAAADHGWVPASGMAGLFRQHGYCASLGGDTWIVQLPGSLITQGDVNGTGHPNLTGQQVYRDRIYEQVIRFNPPVTTATAVAGESSYEFGTPTDQDVTVTLSARNPIAEAGVGDTFYALDEPRCSADALEFCSLYTGPFVISSTGKPGERSVTFLSENATFGVEQPQSVTVLIDRRRGGPQPPLDPPGLPPGPPPSPPGLPPGPQPWAPGPPPWAPGLPFLPPGRTRLGARKRGFQGGLRDLDRGGSQPS